MLEHEEFEEQADEVSVSNLTNLGGVEDIEDFDYDFDEDFEEATEEEYASSGEPEPDFLKPWTESLEEDESDY